MTDAEIKELAIKHNIVFAYQTLQQERLIAFAKEIESITHEKALNNNTNVYIKCWKTL